MTIMSRIKERIRPSQPNFTSTAHHRIIPTPPGFNAAKQDTFGKAKPEISQPQLLDHLEEEHPYFNPNSRVRFEAGVTEIKVDYDEVKGKITHQDSFDREHHTSYARTYSSTKDFMNIAFRKIRV